MAFSRGLGVIGIVGISWFVAVGCGDDDGKKTAQPNAGGEGGEAPNGGTPSVAGSQNAGGAGAPSGGAGGEAAGGSAGEASITPSGGAAGDGGASGAGGDAPAIALKQCGNECEIDDDCKVPNTESPGSCNEETHRCQPAFALESCTTSDDCILSLNFWTPCVNTAGCADAELVCATWHGEGYCMGLPSADACFEGDVPLTLAEFGTVEGTVDVCIRPAACKSGECVPPCEQSGCPEGQDGNTCSPSTHLCECQLDSECTSQSCGADHQCQRCKTDQDCKNLGMLGGVDVCSNGSCGCSSAVVCPNLTTGQTPVCE